MAKKNVAFTCKSEEKPPGENKKTTNIILLLSMLLNQENKDIKYYAGQLKCSEITIKKYIKEIRASYDATLNKGFYIDHNKKDNYYVISSGNNFLPLNSSEMESLYEALMYLTAWTVSPYKNLDIIKEKLQKLIHNELKKELDKHIAISAPITKSKLKNILNTIDKAIRENKKLIIDYSPTCHKNRVTREIVPFCLLNHDHEWYIRAFCLKDKKIKTYSINQIEDIKKIKELTETEENELPENPELNVEHMWDWDNGNNIVTEVVIKFTGSLAQRMKKKLQYRTEHPSQKIRNYGEDVMVSFKVKNPFNMISWILQFGSQAEIVEPESLRDKIRIEIDRIKTLY